MQKANLVKNYVKTPEKEKLNLKKFTLSQFKSVLLIVRHYFPQHDSNLNFENFKQLCQNPFVGWMLDISDMNCILILTEEGHTCG